MDDDGRKRKGKQKVGYLYPIPEEDQDKPLVSTSHQATASSPNAPPPPSSSVSDEPELSQDAKKLRLTPSSPTDHQAATGPTPYENVKDVVEELKDFLIGFADESCSPKRPPPRSAPLVIREAGSSSEASADGSVPRASLNQVINMLEAVNRLQEFLEIIPRDSSEQELEELLQDFQISLGFAPWPSWYSLIMISYQDLMDALWDVYVDLNAPPPFTTAPAQADRSTLHSAAPDQAGSSGSKSPYPPADEAGPSGSKSPYPQADEAGPSGSKSPPRPADEAGPSGSKSPPPGDEAGPSGSKSPGP